MSVGRIRLGPPILAWGVGLRVGSEEDSGQDAPETVCGGTPQPQAERPRRGAGADGDCR